MTLEEPLLGPLPLPGADSVEEHHHKTRSDGGLVRHTDIDQPDLDDNHPQYLNVARHDADDHSVLLPLDHDTPAEVAAGTIASHDTGATGAELDTLTDGSDASVLHTHGTHTTAHPNDHLEAHGVLSHNDVSTATGPNLDTLVGGGATTLHKHDHGGQDGLGDDDHTIYVLADGTRAFSGDVNIEQAALEIDDDGTDPLTIRKQAGELRRIVWANNAGTTEWAEIKATLGDDFTIATLPIGKDLILATADGTRFQIVDGSFIALKDSSLANVLVLDTNASVLTGDITVEQGVLTVDGDTTDPIVVETESGELRRVVFKNAAGGDSMHVSHTAGDDLTIESEVANGSINIAVPDGTRWVMTDNGNILWKDAALNTVWRWDEGNAQLDTHGQNIDLNTGTLLGVGGHDAGTVGIGERQTYTPAWTSTGTAPAIGNGTISGFFYVVGRLAFVTIYMNYGSTSTYGTGSYRLSLPLTISTTVSNAVQGFSRTQGAELNDASGPNTRYWWQNVIVSSTTIGIRQGDYSGVPIAQWGATVPFTPTTNDEVRVLFVCEIA